jgi:sugar phosphate isomerase/epimerase
LYRKNLESLKRILGLAKLHGVYVVGIIFPQSPGYRKTGSFGRYGIRRSEVDSLMNELHDLEKVYDNFRIMDENKMGNHDYPDSLAVNHDHLLNKAAKIMVPRIENVLKEFSE